MAYARDGRLAVREIDTRTSRISAESRSAPPAGQHGPTEITVAAGDPGLVVVAWRSFPVGEGPRGPSDAAATVLRGDRPGAGKGDLVA